MLSHIYPDIYPLQIWPNLHKVQHHDYNANQTPSDSEVPWQMYHLVGDVDNGGGCARWWHMGIAAPSPQK